MSLLTLAYQSGTEWRQAADEAAVLDLATMPLEIQAFTSNPAWRRKVRHRVRDIRPALDLEATLCRESGYYSSGLLPNGAFDSCIHLSVAYGQGELPEGWRHQHDITQALCEGAFGMFLPLVWVQPPDPIIGGGDVHHDRFHFRLFVDHESWKMPLSPRVPMKPLTYITWEEYRTRVTQGQAA